MLLSGHTLILNLGDDLICTLVVGDILALFLRNKATLLLGHRLTNLLANCLIPRSINIKTILSILLHDKRPSLPCLTLLLLYCGALLPDNLPAQGLLPGDALLLQLRLVDSLTLLLVHRVAGLDVELRALGVRVRGADLDHEIFFSIFSK